MQYVYFTITAIFLYLASDMILTKIEAKRGKPLPNRSVIFFAIILVLAVVSFQMIEHFMG
ncbi:MAG: hypothetical protein DRQ59_03860 [Gammaproteobacteria bacterium]|nr:MAG: hypothetical protein DRQ59_03860 [Gammaproteobacteria bacterium]